MFTWEHYPIAFLSGHIKLTFFVCPFLTLISVFFATLFSPHPLPVFFPWFQFLFVWLYFLHAPHPNLLFILYYIIYIFYSFWDFSYPPSIYLPTYMAIATYPVVIPIDPPRLTTIKGKNKMKVLHGTRSYVVKQINKGMIKVLDTCYIRVLQVLFWRCFPW